MHKLAIAAAAAAAVLAAPAAHAGKKKADNPDQTVCRMQTDSTSRIARTKTCQTRAEWAQEDAERRHEAEKSLESTGRIRELGNTFRNVVSEAQYAPR